MNDRASFIRSVCAFVGVCLCVSRSLKTASICKAFHLPLYTIHVCSVWMCSKAMQRLTDWLTECIEKLLSHSSFPGKFPLAIEPIVFICLCMYVCVQSACMYMSRMGIADGRLGYLYRIEQMNVHVFVYVFYECYGCMYLSLCVCKYVYALNSKCI